MTKTVLSARSGPTLALKTVLLIAAIFTLSACDTLGGKKTPAPQVTPPPKVEVTPPPATQPTGYTRDPSRFYTPAYMAGERPIRVALLLPFTYSMDPTAAIVLLAATYVGAEYGGSVPAILIRTPGTNAAAATVLDGYEMNKQGKAGLALGISLYSGILGSLFGLTMLVVLSKPLSDVALSFTPPAYFALGILGQSFITTLSGDSLIKGMIAAVLSPTAGSPTGHLRCDRHF